MLPAIRHARAHGRERRGIGHAAHLHTVSFRHAPRRRDQRRRPCAVVAHQQQAFAGLVQPSQRSQPGQVRTLQQCIDAVASALVARGGQDSARFVQGHVHALRRAHRRGVHLDARARRAGVLWVANQPTFYTHATVTHGDLGLAARARATPRNLARQAMAWLCVHGGGDGFGRFAHRPEPSIAPAMRRRLTGPSHWTFTTAPEHSSQRPSAIHVRQRSHTPIAIPHTVADGAAPLVRHRRG